MNDRPKSLHLAVVMDGNRRYAKRERIPVAEGHRRGYRKLREVVEWAIEYEVGCLTVYGFSTENWKRDETEVSALLELFSFALRQMVPDLVAKNIRIRFIGDRTRLPDELVHAMTEAERITATGDALTLTVALSYGARDEILRAVRALVDAGDVDVTEQRFAASLDTKELPDPDLLLRTGGERRLSNFLLWQSAYSELFFVDSFWPDLTKEEFVGVLREYHSRERRHGV
jgi:undecaprenyl diphosphate synthase